MPTNDYEYICEKCKRTSVTFFCPYCKCEDLDSRIKELVRVNKILEENVDDARHLQYEAERENARLKEEKETIRAGIKHFHDGKISLSQLMDFY